MTRNFVILFVLLFLVGILVRVIIPSPIVSQLTGKITGEHGVSEKIPINDVEQLHLQNDLQEEIASLGLAENVSLYYKNLSFGYVVGIKPDRPWVPASMVKAYVLVEAFRQKEGRLINFDSRVTIKPENVVPTELESPEYQPLREGSRATIRELVYAMIVQSDNTAYNTLIDVLDRRNLTSTLRQLGLADTVVGEKLSLSDEQYALDTLVPGRQPNTTTAHDFGRLLDLLYQGKIQNSAEVLTILKQQKFKDMIPALLPAKVEVAHKTGTWSPYFHDGGVVYKPGEPFILVVFTNNNDPTVVAKLAKIAYYATRDVVLGDWVCKVTTSLGFLRAGGCP